MSTENTVGMDLLVSFDVASSPGFLCIFNIVVLRVVLVYWFSCCRPLCNFPCSSPTRLIPARFSSLFLLFFSPCYHCVPTSLPLA